MASIKLCSNEDLEAIFYHLDFLEKSQFRRCCRRWNYLLSSPAALHTVIFNLAANKYSLTYCKPSLAHLDHTLQRLRTILSPMVNLAFVGRSIDEYVEVYNTINVVMVAIAELPSPQQQPRRLYLCNFCLASQYMLPSIYQCSVFDWIELRNVKIHGSLVRDVLRTTARLAGKTGDPDAKYLPLRQRDGVGVEYLTVAVPGRVVWKSPLMVPAKGTQRKVCAMTALLGPIRENVRHLTKQETANMLMRLRGPSQDGVQTELQRLLQFYAPDLPLPAVPSYRTFDYNLCSPLVGRVLGCYDGTGGSDWSDHDDEYASDDYDQE